MEAERNYREALILFRGIKDQEGVANVLNNLGLVHRDRGSLSDAEKSFREALVVNEKLKRLEGMAINHRNLGEIAELRNGYLAAKGELQVALELYRILGLTEESTRCNQ